MSKQSKFSRWFDADVMPTRSGVFQREYTANRLLNLVRTYNYFDTGCALWYTGAHSAPLALAQFKDFNQCSQFQSGGFWWRGMSTDTRPQRLQRLPQTMQSIVWD